MFFPLSMIKLKSESRNIENAIFNIQKTELYDIKTIKKHILNEGIEFITMIATKLGDNTFLYENR
jgi:hypothetical protein